MTFWCDRRAFLRDCALGTLAVSATHGRVLWGQQPGFRALKPTAEAADKTPLDRGFVTPPDWAKPWAYWWWLNGYVTRDGIVRDLDAMKKQGINGVLVFDAGGGKTPESNAFMSQAWRDLFKFAVQEADKRGMEVSLNLCSGWNAGGPWITADQAPQQLVFSRNLVKGPQKFEGQIAEPKHLNDYYRDVAVLAYKLQPADKADAHAPANAGRFLPRPVPGVPVADPVEHTGVCRTDSFQDISSSMDHSGHLNWQVPEGDWLILRFGHTVEMPANRVHIVQSGPGPDHGYEIDPLNADAMQKQFEATAGKVVQDCKPWLGKTLKYFHIDSWEIGTPNWTPAMQEEFKRRRGYDLLPYLAAMTGETVNNQEITARFIEDFQLTLGDLTVDNYYGKMAELSHRYGVGIHPESEGYQKPYTDSLKALGRSDIPMGEFWSRTTQPMDYIHQRTTGQLRWHDSIKEGASAAHIYGLPVSQAEAFTGTRSVAWSEYPYSLKDIGDRAFCAGLTRYVFNVYTAQPDANFIPGYQTPTVSIKFDRNTTWWGMGHAWVTYISRCQYLFQRGRFAADVCYFYGEESPNYVPAKDLMNPPLPKGFDCDSINAEAMLSRMTVKDSRLMLPDGLSYRLLVMPYLPWSIPPNSIFASSQDAHPGPGNGLPVGISLPVMKKIKELVEGGATVLGPKPSRAPGLSEYPQSDSEIEKIATELWGDTASQPSGQRTVGKGRVIWGKTITEIFTKDGVVPDFNYLSEDATANLDYIHYTSGNTEIYFLANQNVQQLKAECRFRVSDMQPELWDPITGEMHDLQEFSQDHGQMAIPLEFASRQSFFVVFRKPLHAASQKKGRENFPATTVAQQLDGSWQVSFDPKWGGPKQVTFDKLQDWTERPEDGIHYYSGTATYRKTFDLPAGAGKERMFLDLGAVNYLASVRLNGQELGVVWTAPWSVEITKAVKPQGNLLEIDVVNTWTNRLIGDAKLPAAQQFTKTNVVPNPDWKPMPSGLLGPVTVRKEKA